MGMDNGSMGRALVGWGIRQCFRKGNRVEQASRIQAPGEIYSGYHLLAPMCELLLAKVDV